ncbi:uncharacterized protein LOC117188649 [Drosophila miranda]|uniref:uncharacterized protein LOC117188649 n=1 Tax=Drosophila miranda TaxID=7229 RepID=UPI00143F47A5|nr:uncharacterized protein LOC117188649 [Drosophila miranda]
MQLGQWKARDPKKEDKPGEKPGSSKEKPTKHLPKGDEKKMEQDPGTARNEKAVYDAKVNLLCGGFFAMLDCSPQPEEAFHPNSHECYIAREWLRKLTFMNCNTVFKARIRKAYMSALLECFNQGRLFGILKQMPPEELNWMDFPDTTYHASRQKFDTCRGMPQNCSLEDTMGLGSPQSSSEQSREAVDRQQRFMDESEEFMIEHQVFRTEEPQSFQQQPRRYQEQSRTETFYDPTTFPPPPHVGQQSGSYYKPSHVKFDTFGAPPRFIAERKDGKEFSPSGAEGGGVPVEDFDTAIIEAPPDPHSAMPTRSILKHSCINNRKTPVSFNDKPCFDDDRRPKTSIQSYRAQFPSRKECGFKGSNQKKQKNGTQTNQSRPEASGEEYDRVKIIRTVTTNRRCNRTFLMECIRRELRGETSEGANDYLEGEIERYKTFSQKYSCNDPEYKEKMLGGDPNAQRTYLLLNMQQDLTKFLTL